MDPKIDSAVTDCSGPQEKRNRNSGISVGEGKNGGDRKGLGSVPRGKRTAIRRPQMLHLDIVKGFKRARSRRDLFDCKREAKCHRLGRCRHDPGMHSRVVVCNGPNSHKTDRNCSKTWESRMIQILEKTVPVGILRVIDRSKEAGIKIGFLPQEGHGKEKRCEENPHEMEHRTNGGLVGTHRNSA